MTTKSAVVTRVKKTPDGKTVTIKLYWSRHLQRYVTVPEKGV